MIAIVGAGPVGIEIAVALQRAGIPYVHLEAGEVGSTMAWWAPGTRWFSSNERIAIAGVPLVTTAQEKATREEYLAYLRAVVQEFNLSIRTFTEVVAIKKNAPAGFALEIRPALHKNPPTHSMDVSKIILATGGTAFPNLLNIPGENLPHVSHYFQDPHRYFGKQVLIVGGRNSAVEAAMRCFRIGADVHFCHYAPGVDAQDIKYWLYPEFSSLLKAGRIAGHFETRVSEILPDTVRLKPVAAAAPETEIPADFVLLMTGYRADMRLARMAGVEVVGEDGLPRFNPDTMETHVPGVYVAGTAVAGTQRRYKVFLENCHVHAPKIIAHLLGQPPPDRRAAFERPES